MKGVNFLVNEAGDKTAVILDLRKRRRIWEDMYDRMLIESPKNEPRESLEHVRKRLNIRGNAPGRSIRTPAGSER